MVGVAVGGESRGACVCCGAGVGSFEGGFFIVGGEDVQVWLGHLVEGDL